MAGTPERRSAWPPPLPDLFGWMESGLPGWHTMPGPHAIRIEEQLTVPETETGARSVPVRRG